MPTQQLFMVGDDGRIATCDMRSATTLSELPPELVASLTAMSRAEPFLLSWSPIHETYFVVHGVPNQVCMYKRIRHLMFNAPYREVSRAMLEALDPTRAAGLPESAKYVMFPEVAPRQAQVNPTAFRWKVPDTMGLFVCSKAPGNTSRALWVSQLSIRGDSASNPAARAHMTNTEGVGTWYLVAVDLTGDNGTRIYRPPFPNIHSNGQLCCGTPALKLDLCNLEESLAASVEEWGTRVWNTDLITTEDKRALPGLILGNPDTNETIPPTLDWRQCVSRISDPFEESGTAPSTWFFDMYLESNRNRRLNNCAGL